MEQELQQVTHIYNLITTYLVTYAFQILGAIIILAIGVFLGRRLGNVVLALCQKRNWDITLSRFFASCTRIAIIAASLVIALPKLGIQVTPFIAAIGALGLGAGLAVQGLLSNYGAGLSIILTRPFVVGDTIKVQGVAGLVKEVHLSHTVLTNEDNELITIPNKHIIGEIIHNSQADSILELGVGIPYDSDPQQAIAAIREAVAGVPGLSTARSPLVGIDGFGDSAIELGIRVWARTDQLYEVRYQVNLAVFQALHARGISIPFPQREVRMLG
ncbi:MAG: hypothetical protein RLZZ385_1336 [Pseudomonadota bacterium]|jgi:small conductance mechanosensitive channel